MNIFAELTLQKYSKAAAMGTICHAEPLQGSCAFDKENSSDGKPSTEVHATWQLTLAGSFSRLNWTGKNYPSQRPYGYLGRETPELYRSGHVFRINPDVARISADAAGRASVLARNIALALTGSAPTYNAPELATRAQRALGILNQLCFLGYLPFSLFVTTLYLLTLENRYNIILHQKN
jgi:hypothetical protein